MARAIGSEIRAAAKLGATWGTAVACGVNDGILIRPSGFKKSRPNLLDDSLGLYFPRNSDSGEISAEGDITAYGRYAGVGEMLMAAAMGTAATVHTVPSGAGSGTATGGTATTLIDAGGGFGSANERVGAFVTMTGGTNAGKTRKIISHTDTQLTFATMTDTVDNLDTYTISDSVTTHTYDLADSIDGLFATICLMNNVNVDELPSAKVTGFTIKGTVGQPLEIAFQLKAIDRVPDSAVNTLVTMATVTYRESGNRILYSHGVCRMNDRAYDGSDVALAPGDAIYPSSFELTFSRKQTGVYGVGGDFNVIDEPSNDGIPEVMVKMEFPRYTSAEQFEKWNAATPRKLDFTFLGGLLGDAATQREFRIEFPNLKYASVDLPIVEGILKHPVEFNALGCDTAPDGMANLTAPFRITTVNQVGNNPLQPGN